MLALEKLADWWDTQKKESEGALNSFVDNHPNMFGVAVAGSVKTAMDLGAGFVDVLRLGEGVKQGGWGYAADGLRLVSLAGPVARAGRFGLTSFVRDVPGGLCARVSATQALRMTGTSHFASVDDIVRTFSGRAISSMTEMSPELEQLGARVRNLSSAKSLEHVKELVHQNPNGVITFAVKWSQSDGNAAGHSLVAYRDWLGRVRFLDRTGVTGATLQELEDGLSRLKMTYDGIEKAVPMGSLLHIANSTVTTAVNGLSSVAVETRALMLTSIQSANRAFESHLSSRKPAGPALKGR